MPQPPDARRASPLFQPGPSARRCPVSRPPASARARRSRLAVSSAAAATARSADQATKRSEATLPGSVREALDGFARPCRLGCNACTCPSLGFRHLVRPSGPGGCPRGQRRPERPRARINGGAQFCGRSRPDQAQRCDRDEAAAPAYKLGFGAFSGATSSGREVGASGSEPDLAILLLGSWHAGIIGAGPHNDLCSSPSDERRQMKVTFHRDGNYERSIEPTAGKWRAAGPLLVVQFQSEQGRWHDGDGKPGASKHVVEVVSRDQVLIRPVGGLGATEQYRRCASDR